MAKIQLTDYWAPWCGPCKMMNPIIDELKKEHPDVEFEEVNVDENQKEAQEKGVMSIPTFIVYKDGQEVGRKIGMTSKDELVKLIRS